MNSQLVKSWPCTAVCSHARVLVLDIVSKVSIHPKYRTSIYTSWFQRQGRNFFGGGRVRRTRYDEGDHLFALFEVLTFFRLSDFYPAFTLRQQILGSDAVLVRQWW